jgi:hypothetical protein
MGVLPCQFKSGDSVLSLGIKGDERFDVTGFASGIVPQMDVTLTIHRKDGTTQAVPVLLRIDTPIEVDYYLNGGILPVCAARARPAGCVTGSTEASSDTVASSRATARDLPLDNSRFLGFASERGRAAGVQAILLILVQKRDRSRFANDAAKEPLMTSRLFALIMVAAIALVACGQDTKTSSDVKKSAAEAADKAKEAASKAAEAAKEAASKAAEATKEVASKAAEATKEAAGKAVEATKEAADKTAEATKEAASKAAEATKEAASKATEATKDAVKK